MRPHSLEPSCDKIKIPENHEKSPERLSEASIKCEEGKVDVDINCNIMHNINSKM